MAFYLRLAVLAAKAKTAEDETPPRQPPRSTKPEFRNLEETQEDLQRLGRTMPHVAARALNKAMTGVKTDLVRLIREDYNLKASAIRKRISIKRAKKTNISGHVQSKGRPPNMTDVTGTRQTKRGVSVNVKKSTGRQLIPRAFIRRGANSGKKLVLRREVQNGRMVARLPVKARYAPHPEHIYNAPHNWAKISDQAAERLDTNIRRETDAEFRKIDGRW